MNNLSITLYAIDVLGNLNTAVGLFTVLSGCLLLFALFVKQATSDRDYKGEIQANDQATNAVKYLLPIFIVLTSLNIVIPDKRTVRLIVASEFSEVLYKSEEVQEIVNPAKKALKKWLDDYTKEVK